MEGFRLEYLQARYFHAMLSSFEQYQVRGKDLHAETVSSNVSPPASQPLYIKVMTFNLCVEPFNQLDLLGAGRCSFQYPTLCNSAYRGK